MQPAKDIVSTLTRILRANLNDSTLVVTADTRPETVPGWDSIKMVDIILDSEDAFGVRLSADDIDRIRTVGDLIAALDAQLAVPSSQNSPQDGQPCL